MWDTINNALSGNNSIAILVFALLVIIIVTMLVKGNYVKVDTSVVKIGANEQERSVLRQQSEWTYQYVSGLYGQILTIFPHLNKDKTKYILECIYDEIIVWIMFNHITRSDMYVMVKQEKLISIVSGMDVDPAILSDEFKKKMNTWTKEIINRLVDIREYYINK